MICDISLDITQRSQRLQKDLLPRNVSHLEIQRNRTTSYAYIPSDSWRPMRLPYLMGRYVTSTVQKS
jgi:hypothetical protein